MLSLLDGLQAITNVVRLFELLHKSDKRQMCYYQPGIGTFDEKIPVANQEPSKVSTLSKGLEAVFAKQVVAITSEAALYADCLVA